MFNQENIEYLYNEEFEILIPSQYYTVRIREDKPGSLRRDGVIQYGHTQS